MAYPLRLAGESLGFPMRQRRERGSDVTVHFDEHPAQSHQQDGSELRIAAHAEDHLGTAPRHLLDQDSRAASALERVVSCRYCRRILKTEDDAVHFALVQNAGAAVFITTGNPICCAERTADSRSSEMASSVMGIPYSASKRLL